MTGASKGKAPWLVPLLAGLLVLIVLVWGLLKPGPSSVQIGGRAPDFTLPLLDGGDIRLREMRGQVVVLNFWASWCGPCRLEASVLEQAWNAYGDEVSFVGIAHSDTLQPARAFVQHYGVTYPNGLDTGGDIARAYGLTGVPETFVIDPEGVLRAHRVGAIIEADVLAAMIEEALSTSP